MDGPAIAGEGGVCVVDGGQGHIHVGGVCAV